MLKPLILMLMFGAAAVGQSPPTPLIRERVADVVPKIGEELSFPRYPDSFSVGEVKGRIAPAKAIYLPKPAFTDEAREAAAEGKVRVEIVIAADGTVRSAVAVSGPPEHFGAAEKAASNARFLPVETETAGSLTFEFVVRRPNWFEVAYDLYAIAFSNPGLIRKAFPDDWIEERTIAAKLEGQRRKQLAMLPVELRSGSSPDRLRALAKAAVPPSPDESATLAGELVERIRARLAEDVKALAMFELGEALILAQSAMQDAQKRSYANGLIRRAVNNHGPYLPASVLESMLRFLRLERHLFPGGYRREVFLRVETFRDLKLE